VIIDAVLSVGKPQTIAFLYEQSDFGNSTTRPAKEYATKKGLKIVGDEAYCLGLARLPIDPSTFKGADRPPLHGQLRGDAISVMRQGGSWA